MEEKKYNVYILSFPNNKKYIGITTQKPQYRWNNGKRYKYNKEMYNDIQKFGWQNITKEIIKTEINELEAEKIERKLIQQYKSNQKKYGYNIQNGGKKGNNIVSNITKIKIKNKLKNTRHGMAIYKMKPVDMFDINNNFIKHFDSITDCQNETGIRKQYISLCCLGKKNNINGFIFKYNK